MRGGHLARMVMYVPACSRADAGSFCRGFQTVKRIRDNAARQMQFVVQSSDSGSGDCSVPHADLCSSRNVCSSELSCGEVNRREFPGML